MSCNEVYLKKSENGVATIVLDDPISKNALSNDVIKELAKLLQECEYDPEIRLVIMKGANGCFSSGGNINTLKEQIDNQSADRSALGHLCDAGRRLKDLSKPTICMIEGSAAGAGISLAMACDFSIAADNAKFAFAFINLALVSDTGAAQLLVQTAGVNKAKQLLLGNRMFSAVEAEQWGVISQAVPAEKLEEEVQKLAKRLLNTSPLAYKRMKTLINRCAYRGYDEMLQNEAEYQYASLLSDDHREGVYAFVEKRKPNYKTQ